MFYRKRIKYFVIVALLLPVFLLQQPLFAATMGSKVFEREYSVAPGVVMKKESFEQHSTRRAVNYLIADPANANVSLQMAFGSPFNRLNKTTTFAHRDTILGSRHVVGSVNGSFFLTNGSGLPANLVVENNQILHLGRLSTTANDPVFNRYAFGINANGKPLIDSYKEDIQLSVNGTTNTIHTVNGVRQPNQAVLFTPSLGYNVPKYDADDSLEIVVTQASKDTSALSFGDSITGRVSEVFRNNTSTNQPIPADGFVIALNGKELADKFAHVQAGSVITVTLSIDAKWMNSKAMIAAGPMLVQGGAVNISMNESSSFARSLHPRTAVGITRDHKLILATVDGRQNGYSNGMSLRELAQYMISLGAVQAMNLDGGGSTTMAARVPGHELAYLVNRPSDGQERVVSNAIQIVSAAGASVIAQNKIELDSLRNISNWYGSFIRGTGTVAAKEAMKLTYDFTLDKTIGTSAAYAVAKHPILVEGKPLKIGMWVHGDGKENWLRLQLTDRELTTQVINVTEENQLNWSGWRYVTADIPATIKAPFSIAKIYIAQTKEEKKTRGMVHFSNLDAIYQPNVQPPPQPAPVKIPQLFFDLPNNHWSADEIAALVDQQVISGFPDGTFRPIANVTREQVASLLVRQLKLSTANRKVPGFSDVPVSSDTYAAIATVAELGLMTGRERGLFHPKASLTRAEAAIVLKRAYNLTGVSAMSFSDVPVSHWAYDEIQTLAANKITTGISVGQFGPHQTVTREQFSVFLYRAATMK